MEDDFGGHTRRTMVNSGLTRAACQPRVDTYGCGVGAQARPRRGRHAARECQRGSTVEVEQHGEERLVVIGPDRAGSWLELVAVPAEEADRITSPTGCDRSSTSS